MIDDGEEGRPVGYLYTSVVTQGLRRQQVQCLSRRKDHIITGIGNQLLHHFRPLLFLSRKKSGFLGDLHRQLTLAFAWDVIGL